MPTLADLLADPDSHRVLVLKMTSLDADGATVTRWLSQEHWQDPPDGPVAGPLVPLLETGLQITDSFDPYDPEGSPADSYSEVLLINNSVLTELAGFWDLAYLESIDELEQILYIVGTLGDGIRIELADVLATPFRRLVGVGSPSAGDDIGCKLTVRTQRFGMGRAMSTASYTPACAVFPGGSGVIAYGDVLDLGSQGHIRIKFMCSDVSRPDQILRSKDGGTTGWAIIINSGGSSPGSLTFLVRGQAPATTATANNAIRSGEWVIAGFDYAATTRRIDIGGAQAALTTSITGATTTNILNLVEGVGFVGQISDCTHYTVSKTVAAAAPEIRAPVLPGEADLESHMPHDEGTGAQITDRKTGSAIVGTLSGGVTLDGVSGWHLAGLGPAMPSFIGRVTHFPIEWFDMASQVAMVRAGGFQLIETLRFGFNPVSTANYSVDRDKGIIRLTTGSIPQTGAGVQALANSPWSTALSFDGSTTSAIATQAGPTGSRSLTVHIRCDSYDATLRYIVGRQVGANAGTFVLRLTSTGSFNNRLEIVAINDAGTIFVLTYAVPLALGLRIFVAARLDSVAQRLSLWIDRREVASTTVSGAWTTSMSSYGVGCRADTSGNRFVGIIDDPHEWDSALSDSALKALHLSPVVGSKLGLWYGHNLDEGSGATAASSVVGKAALTITSPAWGAGRCSAGDLAWQCFREAGYDDSAQDAESWGAFIAAQPADQGMRVESGMLTDAVALRILGGVGARTRELFGVVYVERFEGVTGIIGVELTTSRIRSGPVVTAQPAGPPVYWWRLESRVNDLPLPAGEVAAALLSSDPAGYVYASKPAEIAHSKDDRILERFPGALEKDRKTAFFKKSDADAEALRLRQIFRDGSAPFDLQIVIDEEDLAVLDEIPAIDDVESAGLDQGGAVVISINNNDGNATATFWRPGAVQPALIEGNGGKLVLSAGGKTLEAA